MLATMRTFVATVAVLVAAPAAGAADWPGTFGLAERGSLKLVAGVLLHPTGGEMKGVWIDSRQSCLTRRTLRVSIQIDLVNPNGTTTRVRRSKRALVENCAEGGPNYGYDLTPRAWKLGCRSGRWKPGRYAMTTRVTDVRTGLVAQTSLYHQVTRRC
jgi:hypothetical protein